MITTTVYREEVKHLVDWYKTNNLALNIDKTKEIIVDFRRSQPSDTPHLINHTAVEKVRGTKFQRVPITDTLTWSLPPIQDNAKTLPGLTPSGVTPPTATMDCSCCWSLRSRTEVPQQRLPTFHKTVKHKMTLGCRYFFS